MNQLFKNRSRIVMVSWLVILLYAVSSIYLLVMSAGWIKNTAASQLPTGPLIAYAVISFLLTALVSIYHLSTFIRRRRRRTDRQRLSRAHFIRAKHHKPGRKRFF